MATRVIFYSKNRCHRIGADKIQGEVRYSDGRIARPSHMIVFDNHLFITTDSREIKLIKETDEFRLNRIRQVTEEEAHNIIAEEAKKLGLPVEAIKEHEILKNPVDFGYEQTEKVEA